ncbi:MAG: Ig-like domain-containing protein, partial [Planctomycetaceae bacterium]
LSSPIAIDTVLPQVTISSNKSALRAGEFAVLTFVLSEPSTSFTADDVTVTGGVLSGFTGSGTTYSASFVPLANSTANGTVTVAAGRFFDAAGNPNTAGALTPSIPIDTQPPTITITTDRQVLRTLRTATITFTLSEPSTTFGREDVVVTGGTLTNFTGSGRTYTAVFTPVDNAMTTGTVAVAGNTFTDAAGNPNAAGALTPPMTIDTIVPTIALASSAATLRAGQTALISFLLSEPSTTFTAEDVVVTGGTLSGFSGSGQSYSAVFTPLAGSTAPGTVKVAARSFFDAANNPNTAGELLPPIAIDTVLPTVGIAVSRSTLRAGETAVVTFTLSKPSTTFTLADVTVVGGSLSAFSGSGAGYTAVFTPSVNSTVAGTIAVAAGGFTDAVGNGNAAGALSPPIAIDTVRPTVSISTDRPVLRTLRVANITFVLSKPSTSFGADDVSVTGGTVSGFTGSGTTYSAVFTPFNNVTMNGTVSVSEGRFFDAVGNANTAAFLTPAMVIDTVVPTVAITSNAMTLRAGQTAVISFVLSEPSTSFAAEDVTVTGGTLSAFSGSGRFYSAVFTPLPNSTAAGTVAVAAKAFFDAANNPNAAGALSPSIVVDTAAPAVVIATNKPRLGIGETATLTFTLSETSTTFSAAAIAVTGGTIANFAGSGRTFTATFTPTPNVGGTAVIRVPAARFTDAVGNANVAARLTPDIVLDTILAASATANGVPLATTAAGSPALTTKVRTITLTFNAAVTGVNPSALRLYYTGPGGSMTVVALAGTTITGSGSTYTITLPATAGSLSGLYQLDVGGPGTAIASAGVGMASKASFFWRRP